MDQHIQNGCCFWPSRELTQKQATDLAAKAAAAKQAVEEAQAAQQKLVEQAQAARQRAESKAQQADNLKCLWRRGYNGGSKLVGLKPAPFLGSWGPKHSLPTETSGS